MATVDVYAGTGSPGPTAVGTLWFDAATGLLKNRDDAGAWNTLMQYNLHDGGIVSKGGGNLVGAITGTHGLAPVVNAALTGTATLNGDDLVTLSTLNAMIQDMQDQITSAVGGSTATPGTDAFYIGIASGITDITVTPNWEMTIPYPTFPDNTSATYGQCVYLVSPAVWRAGGGSGNVVNVFCEDKSGGGPIKFKAYVNAHQCGNWGMTLAYLVIAMKART